MKAIGHTVLSLCFSDNTAPKLATEASVSRINRRERSGYASTGPVVSKRLISSNATWHGGVQSKGTPFFVRACNWLTTLAKFETNLL